MANHPEYAGGYYGQHGEDFVLMRFFDHKPVGFYIDVGAFDGLFLSNSYAFEKHGWEGLCIEPHPQFYSRCRDLRVNAKCINVACAREDNAMGIEFFAEESGLLSGAKKERDAEVAGTYDRQGLTFGGFETTTVAAARLSTLLETYAPAVAEIDFLSLDVEGTELEVLRGLDMARFKPRVLIVEANDDAAKRATDRYLSDFEYINARTDEVNSFYVRTPEDAEKLARIRVNCRLAPMMHPLGDKYTAAVYIKGRVIGDPALESVFPLRMLAKIRRFLRRRGWWWT